MNETPVADHGDPTPPPEPFSYMTDHSYFGVNSPWLLTFYAFFIVGFGVYAVWMAVRLWGEGQLGLGLGMFVAGVAIVRVGLKAVRMGIARMKWKRECERVMGRSPFQ